MEAFSVSGKRHPLYWLQLSTGACKMYFPGSVSLNIMSSRKLWGRPVRGRMLWFHKAFSWLHKFGETRVSKQVCAFESEISSLLNIQHHYSYGPGKSPKSWKLSLSVRPSRDHLTAPQGNENLSLDLTSICQTQTVNELRSIWGLWEREHTFNQQVLLRAAALIYITPH